MFKIKRPFFNWHPLLLLLSYLLFTGCAGPYLSKEAFDKRIGQYHATSPKERPTPSFELLNLDYSPKKDNTPARNLASIEASSTSFLENYQSWSNRKVYFLTLYYQYLYFKGLLPNTMPSLQFCPQFHTGLVDHPHSSFSQGQSKNFFEDFYSIPQWDQIKDHQQLLALFPELSLQATLEDRYPTVIDLLEGPETPSLVQLLHQALGVHLHKTYEELTELCEYGSGPNYFVFENYISYMKENPQFKESLPSMKALLKIPLLINFNLMTSLNTFMPLGRSISSHQTYHELMDVVFDRLQANWSKTYFKELSKRKRSILNKKP